MKKGNNPCDLCEFKGYSPEVCKVHHKRMTDTASKDCPHNMYTLKNMGKAAAVGAGVGALATVVGFVAVPAVVVKAAIGRIGTAAVVVGAGINVARKTGMKRPPQDRSMKKKKVLLI